MLYFGCFLIGFCAGWIYTGVFDTSNELDDVI